MIRKSFIIVEFSLLLILSIYYWNPRVKFYVHHGIWLPGICNNFKFIKYPDENSLFGRDGGSTISSFEIDKSYLQQLVDEIGPQSIWLRYSELDSTLKDSTLHCPCLLPKEITEKGIRIMLWSNDTKGDYYNIWIEAGKDEKLKVSISMPFT